MDNYTLKLTRSLEELSPRNRLMFGFWISKRLFHNYVCFNKKTSFGDIDVMLDAVNLIEEYLKTNDIDRNAINASIYRVEENTPDTNEFTTVLVSFALDACNALSECLKYILDKNVIHMIDIGMFARDTVDMFIQEINGIEYANSDFEHKIQNNELMKKEMNAQEMLLKRLKNEEVTLQDLIFAEIIDLSLI